MFSIGHFTLNPIRIHAQDNLLNHYFQAHVINPIIIQIEFLAALLQLISISRSNTLGWASSVGAH